ncbi:transglycosylase SLT domain-containing protein [Sulfuricurvum sp.]|uniref:transglycosylase SLT domain-containing protein n=1 Tax=Sulfuricurvum sp. TaxID=2025608 RepID=UPI0019A64B13|nr:transglycosylase SLT domain-containing protein [Sulfuricurvum sp.]MBD3798543.1 transglycosylase SLT domain-containing protein [Campylobacterota bacterium]MBD3805520.1 transglycosylase SLT domain-containing protein [Sulfuricurvum sp.]
MRILALIVLMFLSLYADTMTPKQLHVLQTVRDVAKSIPDKNGKTYENTVSAICLTESSAGKNTIGDYKYKKSLTKASLGPMQIKVSTARHVSQNVKKLRWLNNLSDIQLAGRLLGDIKLSAQVATHYLILLQNQRKEHFYAISGYNGGMINRPYYNRVMKNMDVVNHLISLGKLS